MPFNSTIIPKKRILSCGHYSFNFSKGRCKYCATIQDSKKRIEAAKQTSTYVQSLNIKSVGKVADMGLENWFKMVADEILKKPFCMECGQLISMSDYRNATAHIFPKSANSGFPSIATHPLNYLILNTRCGCHNKTHRLDTFSKMKVWHEAVRRFKIFEPQIKEKHKYLSLFKQYSEQLNVLK